MKIRPRKVFNLFMFVIPSFIIVKVFLGSSLYFNIFDQSANGNEIQTVEIGMMNAKPKGGSPGIVINYYPRKSHLLTKGNLKVQGFEYFKAFPRFKIKRERYKIPKMTSSKRDLWFLDSKISVGKIQLNNFQRVFDFGNTSSVVMNLSYHVSSYDRSGMSVLAFNSLTGELSEETLNSVLGPPMYCAKLLFLGPVDEITIKAFAKGENEFVVVDDLKIVVGSDTYDGLDEMKCET